MRTEKYQLVSEAAVAVFQANGKLLEWGDGFTAPFGLTSSRWQILGAIARADRKQTAPQIAEQMGVSRQGAQKQLNLLVDSGLIKKLSNPGHQRSPHYHLTTKGKERFQTINSAWEAHAAEIGENFSLHELETTLQVLTQLAELHALAASGEQNET